MASAASADFLEGIYPLVVVARDADRQSLANGTLGIMFLALAAIYLIADRGTLGGGPIYVGMTTVATVVFDLS